MTMALGELHHFTITLASCAQHGTIYESWKCNISTCRHYITMRSAVYFSYNYLHIIKHKYPLHCVVSLKLCIFLT